MSGFSQELKCLVLAVSRQRCGKVRVMEFDGRWVRPFTYGRSENQVEIPTCKDGFFAGASDEEFAEYQKQMAVINGGAVMLWRENGLVYAGLTPARY